MTLPDLIRTPNRSHADNAQHCLSLWPVMLPPNTSRIDEYIGFLDYAVYRPYTTENTGRIQGQFGIHTDIRTEYVRSMTVLYSTTHPY